MTFYEYLESRLVCTRGATHRGYAALCAIPDWPDAFETEAALKAWLVQSGARPADIRTAKGAWISYGRLLKANGWEMPRKVGDAVCGLPRGVQTVEEAPPLVYLKNLDHALRQVAYRDGAEMWTWCGDLTDIVQLRIYLVMRDVNHTITQLMRYVPGHDRRQVLFARIAEGVAPLEAYRKASEGVLRDAVRNPRWRRTGQAYAGLRSAW